MEDLLQKQNDPICNNSLFDLSVGFHYYDIIANHSIIKQRTDTNYLFFLINGDIIVSYDEFENVPVKAREFFLIPKTSELSIKVLTSGDILCFSFDSFKSVCDKIALKCYATIAEQIDYIFKPLPVQYALNDFIYLLIRYLRNGLDCLQMVDIKQQELFLLIRKYYEKKEVANLFHPILGKTPDFKEQIFQHYQEVNSVDELAKRTGMGRTNFDLKFKSEFGISPLQWILKQKAKHVRFSMAEPGSTLSDIMRKYNFNSPTHLNRFCKQQFGCSPSELMKKMRQKE